MKPIGEQTVMPQASIEPSSSRLEQNQRVWRGRCSTYSRTALSRASPSVSRLHEERDFVPASRGDRAGQSVPLADYFPDDGQLSLIEQVRETIDVHVPEDERAWLTPRRIRIWISWRFWKSPKAVTAPGCVHWATAENFLSEKWHEP
jgi:hypothetical protein